MKLTLRATNSLVERYRTILTSHWSFSTIRDSLHLADDFLNQGEVPLGFSSVFSSTRLREGHAHPLPSQLRRYLQNFTNQTGEAHIPASYKKLPEKFPRRFLEKRKEESKLTIEAIYNLTFPVLAQERGDEVVALEGDISFLRDVQSLLFLLVAQYVLPTLQHERMSQEKAFLIPVLLNHCFIVWIDNPAHQNYLLAVLFDNLGIPELVLQHLYVSFRLTSPEEHDYLTKAQAYWTALIDAKKIDHAEEFALQLLRHSPEKHLDEIKEMMRMTYEINH